MSQKYTLKSHVMHVHRFGCNGMCGESGMQFIGCIDIYSIVFRLISHHRTMKTFKIRNAVRQSFAKPIWLEYCRESKDLPTGIARVDWPCSRGLTRPMCSSWRTLSKRHPSLRMGCISGRPVRWLWRYSLVWRCGRVINWDQIMGFNEKIFGQ